MKNLIIILSAFLALSLYSCKEKGCLDINANNYDPEAEKSDASCVYEKTIKTIQYGTVEQQKFTLYSPKGTNTSTKVVILIHGGGWVVGYNGVDKVTTFDGRYGWDILNPLVDAGYACVVMKYRTACYFEDSTLAAGGSLDALFDVYDDINLVLTYLKDFATELKLDATEVQLIGESAGAHIALSYGFWGLSNSNIKSVVSMFAPTALDDYEWKYNLFKIDSAVPAGVLVKDLNYIRSLNLDCNVTNNTYVHLLDELKSFGDAPELLINQSNNYLKFLSPATPGNIASSVPTFILHGDNDELVPVSQANIMFDAVVAKNNPTVCTANTYSCDLKKTIYTNCGHGWTGASCQKQVIMNDILKWIEAH